MRKAQIEMMGLVVIVLILAVGFLFVFASVARGGQRESAQQIYQKELLAYNTIGSIIQANTGCGTDNTFADLIDDCVYIYDNPCGVDSCDYLGINLLHILNKTLGVRNQEFYFYVLDANNQEAIYINEPCTGDRASATQPYTSRLGKEIIIGIDICT
jgi:hypothetical protein